MLPWHSRSPERAEGAAASSDGSDGNRRKTFHERIDYEALCDFVVSVDRVSPPATAKSPPRAMVLQRDGVFQPHVLPVVVDTEVEWANLDDIFHHVFSISDACGFDLGLYERGDSAKTVVSPCCCSNASASRRTAR